MSFAAYASERRLRAGRAVGDELGPARCFLDAPLMDRQDLLAASSLALLLAACSAAPPGGAQGPDGEGERGTDGSQNPIVPVKRVPPRGRVVDSPPTFLESSLLVVRQEPLGTINGPPSAWRRPRSAGSSRRRSSPIRSSASPSPSTPTRTCCTSRSRARRSRATRFSSRISSSRRAGRGSPRARCSSRRRRPAQRSPTRSCSPAASPASASASSTAASSSSTARPIASSTPTGHALCSRPGSPEWSARMVSMTCHNSSAEDRLSTHGG